MNFLEVNFEVVLEIKIFYFCRKSLVAYKVLKKRNLISFLFLFCPTSFLAASKYIVICRTCYRMLQKHFDVGNLFYDCKGFLICYYIEENKLQIK